LTVVLLTYRRRWRYVKRQIDYWGTQDVELLILDQGNEKPLEANQLPDNIRYINCPDQSYLERLRFSGQLVNTEFVLMINDDDIKFMNVIANCIRELQQDSALIACNGVHSFFTTRGSDILSLLAVSSIDSRREKNLDLETRVRDSMKCLFTDSVFRTQTYKKCVDVLTDHPSPSAFVFTFQLVAAFLGNWKQISELMWMRSYESPSASLTDGVNRQYMLHHWVEDSKNRADVENWVELLATNIEKYVNSEKCFIKNVIRVALGEWCNQEILQETAHYSLRRKIANFFRDLLYEKNIFVYHFLRNYKYKYFPSGVPLSQQLTWLRAQHVCISDVNIDLMKQLLSRARRKTHIIS
jgi:glycosyltransferase domain-containing protein